MLQHLQSEKIPGLASTPRAGGEMPEMPEMPEMGPFFGPESLQACSETHARWRGKGRGTGDENTPFLLVLGRYGTGRYCLLLFYFLACLVLWCCCLLDGDGCSLRFLARGPHLI